MTEDNNQPKPRERKYSRHSSEDGLPLSDMSGRNRHRSQASQMSSKSMKSVRTIDRAQYHEDLKLTLKRPVTKNLLFGNFIVMFGCSFLFGYNLGVLNLLKEHILNFFMKTYSARSNCSNPDSGLETLTVAMNFSSNKSYGFERKPELSTDCVSNDLLTLLWQFTTAIFIPGGMIGAFSSGFVADRLGRRKAIMLCEIPGFFGAGFSAMAFWFDTPELLMIGRFITGINCGMATQLAPMFIAEVTPFNLRGAFGTGHQLFVTIGIFFGAVFSLRETFGSGDLWHYALLINVLPALTCLLGFFFILPDSPRYLLLKKDSREEAEKALFFYRQTKDVQDDMEEMETESPEDKSEEKFTMCKLLSSKNLRIPLFITLALQVIQQLSGINAVIFYSKGIYENCGLSSDSIQYAVLATNAVNVAMTIIAVPIMDKAGRRKLLLYPMLGMILILTILCVSLNLTEQAQWLQYISAMSVVSYVICFAVGLGPIPMMIGAELFRQGPRPMALSLAGFTNWLFTFVIAMSFESIQKALDEFTFIIFLVLMVFFTLFVYFRVPETKNKTFEEIAAQFAPGDVLEVEEYIDATIDDIDKPPMEDEAFLKNGSKPATENDVFA